MSSRGPPKGDGESLLLTPPSDRLPLCSYEWSAIIGVVDEGRGGVEKSRPQEWTGN